MKLLVEAFPQHLKEALQISHKAELHFPSNNSHIRNILISGLGGSGIGGKIVSQLLADQCAVPILCVNDYVLPEFVNENTLVIVSSYSGDTEETIAAMQEAIARKAEIACVTSGGKVAALAKKNSYNTILIPGGNPPRSMFGYSLVQLFRLLQGYGFCNGNYKQEIENSITLLGAEATAMDDEALSIAGKIFQRIPVLYSEASYEGLAIRWRQQINENSKMLCWHHVFPEMNHNELVGWTGGDDRVAVIIIRNADDHKRSQIRMDISKKLMAEKCDTIIEVHSKGKTRLERTLYLNHLGDKLSIHLAEMRGVDAVAIPAILFLKNELSKV